MDKINDLATSLNYLNYSSFTFANPCGRLPADFPTDKFSYLQDVDDFNLIIPIEAYDTTYLGDRYFSGAVGAVVNDQRFVGWMVGSPETGKHRRLSEALGENRKRNPGRHLQLGHPEQFAHETMTSQPSAARRV